MFMVHLTIICSILLYFIQIEKTKVATSVPLYPCIFIFFLLWLLRIGLFTLFCTFCLVFIFPNWILSLLALS